MFIPLFRARSTSSTRKNTLSDVNMEVPDHDLEPPKFSRRALERLLNDWAAVRAMIMTGHKEESPPSSASTDDINFMQYQGHTTHLDKFTYCLLVKLATQVRSTSFCECLVFVKFHIPQVLMNVYFCCLSYALVNIGNSEVYM